MDREKAGVLGGAAPKLPDRAGKMRRGTHAAQRGVCPALQEPCTSGPQPASNQLCDLPVTFPTSRTLTLGAVRACFPPTGRAWARPLSGQQMAAPPPAMAAVAASRPPPSGPAPARDPLNHVQGSPHPACNTTGAGVSGQEFPGESAESLRLQERRERTRPDIRFFL